MKATIKNIEKLFNFLNEHHVDFQTGADFGLYDDESELLSACENAIENLEESENE